MKYYNITVNGVAYSVSVEETAAGAAPVAPAAAPAAKPEAKAEAKDCEVILQVALEQLNVTMLDGQEIEIRMTIDVAAVLLEPYTMQLVRDVEILPLDKEKFRALPGIAVYVAKPDATIFRPAKELKGFAKVELAAGESKTITIPLDDKAFRYWNVKTDRWEVEGGSYQLRVGASSADIRLTAEVSVKGTNAPDPYEGLDLLHYVSGQITYVTDAEFEALLGHPVPEDVVRIDRNMTLGEMGHGRSPLGWIAAAVLGALLNRSIKKGKPDLNILFQYNMPLRALAKMTNGAISMGMVDGIVMELKGFWIIGILRVIWEALKNVVLNSRMEERLKNS